MAIGMMGDDLLKGDGIETTPFVWRVVALDALPDVRPQFYPEVRSRWREFVLPTSENMS